MQNSNVFFIFSVFFQKYSFRKNLVQNTKIVSLSWNLTPRIWYTKFNGGVHFFGFRPEIPFFQHFGAKKQNYQFKVIFGTETNSDMQNSIVLFTFFVFNLKYPFWQNLVEKDKIVNLIWNLVPRLFRTCSIQWWCFLSVLDCKYPI